MLYSKPVFCRWGSSRQQKRPHDQRRIQLKQRLENNNFKIQIFKLFLVKQLFGFFKKDITVFAPSINPPIFDTKTNPNKIILMTNAALLRALRFYRVLFLFHKVK